MATFETAMILGGSFALGLTHAFEVDHMTAVSSFVSARPRPREAALFGFKWALGHGVSLLIFGSILFALRLAVEESLAHWLERAVGVALLGIGVWSLAKLRSRGVVPVHRHGHGSFWMGLLHGVAGTAAFVGQSFVVASQGYLSVVLYTAAFSAGVLVSMAVFAGALGGMLHWAAGGRMVRRVQTAVALWTCLLGVFWIVR